MSNRQPDYRIPAELINHLAGAIAQPDADSLGQRLVADVFPLITDSPVLFVLWGIKPCCFVAGIEPEELDADKAGLASVMDADALLQKAECIYPGIFRTTTSMMTAVGAKLPGGLGGTVVMSRLESDMTFRGVVAVFTGMIDDPGEPFCQLLSFVSSFVASAGLRINTCTELRNMLRIANQLVENDPSGIAVCTEEGLITDCNRALADLTGLSREKLIGRSVSRLFKPDQVSEIMSRWRRGNTEPYEIEMPTRQGGKLAVRLAPYRVESEATVEYVIQLEDLTGIHELQQKEMEVERLQAVFHAVVAVQDKINTPLSIILAHIERIKLKWHEGMTSEDLERSLGAVEQQVDRVAAILRKMRELKHYKTRNYALEDVMMLDVPESRELDRETESRDDQEETEN